MSTKFNIATRVSSNTMDAWNELLRQCEADTSTLLREIIHGILGMPPPYGSGNKPSMFTDREDGDGRAGAAAAMAKRGLSVAYIAASTKLPWKQVHEIVRAVGHAPKL